MKHITIAVIVSILAGACFAQDKGTELMVGPAGYGFIIADVDANEVVRYSKEGKRQSVYSDVRA